MISKIKFKGEKTLDYKRLKKDLLSKIGPSNIMALISKVDRASDKELEKLAREYGLDLNKYEL